VRFILAALILLGLASYLANPELFGQKKKFSLSGTGNVRLEQRGVKGMEINWEAIGTEFAALILPGENEAPAPPPEVATAANMAVTPPPATPLEVDEISAQKIEVDLGSYEGQLQAISNAIQADPAQTEALMTSATRSCIPTEMPEVLSNYFVKLVALVAVTTQMPKEAQRAHFSAQNAELGATIKLWLFSQPADERAAAQSIMQNWASQPAALVACHLGWLEAR